MVKIKWEVSPVPTGKYRGFSRRGWPIGFLKDNESQRVLLSCEDEYRPSLVKEGNHSEIKVSLDIYNEGYDNYKLVTLKMRPHTLSEAKELAADFFKANPQFIKPKGQKQ